MRYARPLFGIIAVLAANSVVGARGGAEVESTQPVVARIGYLTSIFHDVETRDAEIAVELWMKQLMQAMGHIVETRAVFFDEESQLVAAIHDRVVDIVVLSVLGYLRIHDRAPLEPRFVGVDGDSVTEEYVLLTRRDRGVETLAQLRGTDLIVTKGSMTHSLALMWLDNLLMREGLGRKEGVFEEVREVSRTSKAVLPVFFGQTQACLVSARLYDTVVELNPQVGRELEAVARSPGLPIGLLCVSERADGVLVELFERGARDVGNYAKGRQILTLFKLDGTAEFLPRYLNSALAIVKEHEELSTGETRSESKVAHEN